MLAPFAQPFFLGSPQSPDVGTLYQVAIGGHGYIIDPEQYQRTFLTQLRPVLSDDSDEPGEHTLNPAVAWRRSADDVVHGIGQTYFDHKASDRSRCRTSLGLDLFTQRQVSPLPATSMRYEAQNEDSALQIVSGCSDDLGVYIVDDDGSHPKVVISTDPTSAVPDWTSIVVTGLPTDKQIHSICTDGARVYVVAGDIGTTKVYVDTMPTGAFAALTTTADDYVKVGYACGRLLVTTESGEVREQLADGSMRDVVTHRLGSGFTWNVIVATPTAIVLGGHSGNVTEFYKCAVTDATGVLDPPSLSGTILNEQLRCAVFEGGSLIAGLSTNGGTMGNIRVALVGSGGQLSMGPRVIVPGTPDPVTALMPRGEFVYFGWSNQDDIHTGLGRADLSTFTEDFVPAYAPDVVAGREADGVQGLVSGVAQFESDILFTVDGVGMFATGDPDADDDNETSFSTGRITYGTLDSKVFTSVDASWDPLPTGCSVTCTARYNDGLVRTVFIVDQTDSIGPSGNVLLPRDVHEWVELTFTFTNPAAAVESERPVFRWWLLRSAPMTGPVQSITVPIIMRSVVRSSASDAEAVEVTFDVGAEIAYLLNLTQQEIVSYQEGSRSEDVYVANVMVKPEAWSWDNKVLEGMVLVELHTLE